MTHALEVARQWLDAYGYPGLFVSVFLEGFGIPFPGQSGLMASALMSREGDMNIYAVFSIACTAAFAGDALGYWIGLRLGKAPLERIALAKHAFAKVEAGYIKYGGPIIILARFVEGFRQLNGVVAGAVGMPLGRFMLYNAIGAVLWCGVWGLGLYFAADEFMRLWHAMRPVHISGKTIAILAVALGAIYLLWRAWQRRRTPPATD